MTRDEFKILVKAMKAVYPQDTFIPDQDAFDVWFELLKDLSYKVANLAVQKYMVTGKFPPTIADIREKASEITAQKDDSISEMEAWRLVVDAVSDSGYNAGKRFEELPEACKRAVGGPQTLREWAMMDLERFHTVEQSNFLRVYRGVCEKMKTEAKLPLKMRQLISEAASNMINDNKKGIAQK